MLVVLLGSILLLFFMIETLLIFNLLEYSQFLNIFSYTLIIISFIIAHSIAHDFVNRVTSREEKLNNQLKAIDRTHLIATYDIEGNFLSANRNLTKLLGYKASELKKMNHRDIVPSYLRESREYINFWQNLRAGKSIQGEFERSCKHGIAVWVQSSYTPLKDITGEYTKILKIGVDRTKDRQAQIDITQKNSYLEYAAKILRHDMHSGINTYIPRGVRALKRRLTCEQIHELNIESPLKLIEGGLEHTQKVYAGVKEFTNLVKEDGKITKTETDLTDILQKYIASTAYIKQVMIDKLVVAKVNESLFCTAIDNLIRNGLKYNDSQTRMVHIYMEDPNTLCVQDNGRGMSQSEFEYFSKPYTRGNNTEHGSGLGLNICIAILRIHGFSITAERLKTGTKLRIKIRS
jgi:PAS domain S-box-containing protein